MLDEEALRAALAEDPDDVLPLLADMATATDEALRERVRRIVPRLVLDQARRGREARRGTARMRRVRADRGGDLDLDASMEVIAAARAAGTPPAFDELVAADWARPATALCLVIDRSGSMTGPRLVTAAMAAAACVLRATGEVAVLAFDRRAEVLVSRDRAEPPARVVEKVLALQGHGVTSIDAALRAAAAQLAGASAARRVTLLLSDGRATDDVDPVPAARALDELVVLAPADDSDEAERLARAAGGRMAPIAALEDLPRLLDDLLGPRP